MRLIHLLAVIGLSACTPGRPETARHLEQMNWLLGNWTRTDNKPGHTGWESWHSLSDTEWRGHSGTREGTDTIFHEVTRIFVENDTLYFLADVPENTDPVRFIITAVTDSSFTCENPQHDFPKRIHYRFDGSKLYARVSAGEEGIDFEFARAAN